MEETSWDFDRRLIIYEIKDSASRSCRVF